jgi:hypothetical protein
MHPSSHINGRSSTHYAFDSLHALPCGCVAAIYRSQPRDVQLVALEARGPHCVYREHEIGSVLGMEMGESARLS